MKVQDNSGFREDFESHLLLFEAAYSGLSETVANIVRPSCEKRRAQADRFEKGAKPQAVMDDGTASSVSPRVRKGSGSPLHEVLASGHDEARDLMAELEDISDVFAYEGMPRERDERGISSDKLINYYDNAMADLHAALGSLDHDRSEGLWYERYREDAWRRTETDVRFDNQERRMDSQEILADRSAYEEVERQRANELFYATKAADDYASRMAYERSREMDDYYRRNGR